MLYIKSFSKPSCLIAKIKLEKSVHLEAQKTVPNAKSIQPLAWVTVYCASNCTDFSNFISAIKQGGLDKTLEVYNSRLAQLA